MKLKKAAALCGSLLICLLIYMMYAAKELTGFATKKSISEEFQEVASHHVKLDETLIICL